MNRLRYFVGAVSDFRETLRAPRPHDPRARIRANVGARGESFLRVMRDLVYARPGSPYAQMLDIAGCAYEELASHVRREGLESTLTLLHRSGVYIAHDELKGTQPIIRSNRVVATGPSGFRNPVSSGRLPSRSGGSRSAGTLVQPSAEWRVEREAHDTLTIDEFDLTHRHQILLKPILPAVDGISALARVGRLGCPLDRWFSPIAPSADSAHYRLATYALVAVGRAYGVGIPVPTHLPPNDFSPVVRWIERRRREGVRVAVRTYVSPAVRVALAARDLGVPLDGTLFLVGGETLTDAKRATIEAAGAEAFPHYASTELGPIGHACRHMNRGNSVHLYADSIAVIAHRREAGLAAQSVDSLLFTTLQHHAPLVLVNAEMDDAGTLDESPACSCQYGQVGLTRVIREICSFGKLTGHGVTLVGTDILRIIEQAMPAAFGGAATDYQLVEHNGAGQSQLTLRVGTRVPIASEEQVRDRFFRELRTCHGGQVASRLWRDARALRVEHRDPIATARGKILPLHILGPAGSKRAVRDT